MGGPVDPESITATDDEALARARGLTYWDADAGQYRRPDSEAGESENAPWLTQTQQHSDAPRDDAELFTAPADEGDEGDEGDEATADAEDDERP